MTDLIAAVVDGVRGGSIPRPVPNEPIDDFRFRCAHAGAMLALSWERQPQDVPVTPPPESDVPVTSPGQQQEIHVTGASPAEFEAAVLAWYGQVADA